MDDRSKTHEELCDELERMRARLTALEEEREASGIEAKLRRFGKAFQTMQLGVTITDTDGMILYSNPADATMHGYSANELIGKDVRIFSAAKRRPLSSRQLANLKSWRRETVNIRRDLTTFPVQLMSDVVKAADGSPIGVVTTCEDISERKESEKALRDSETKYRELVENASYGIFRVSIDGRFLSANPALVRMLGLEQEQDLLELDVTQHIYPDASERVRLLAQYRDSERIAGLEVQWRRRDGASITVRLNGRPMRGSGERLDGFEMFAEDVTRQRMLEGKLRESQKMEEVVQLTGGIAHDFNNLLTVMLANAALIRDALGVDRRNIKADLAELEAAAGRGSAMIKRLMSFSRQAVLSFQPLDLVDHIGALLPRMQRAVSERVQINVASEDPVARIHADPSAVDQIIMNVVTNAGEAMSGGGTVTISTRAIWFDDERRSVEGWGDPGQYVCLSIADTGKGMSKETAHRVFEPFFTTKEPGVGTGLGMSVVYGLMKQHRGYVEIISDRASGTRINLYFPVTHEAVPPRVEVEVAAQPRGGGETVLLADDEPAVARAATRVLERFGYSVMVATDGEEALQILERPNGDIALVISDVVMPKMNGPALFEAVRTRWSETKFIFTSGYTARDVRASVALDPSVPFLAKPWTARDLLRTVREVLDEASKGS